MSHVGLSKIQTFIQDNTIELEWSFLFYLMHSVKWNQLQRD